MFGPGLLEVILIMIVYFFPSYVGRFKKNRINIFVCNIFFGWTIIGWFVALSWAYKSEEMGIIADKYIRSDQKSRGGLFRFLKGQGGSKERKEPDSF